MKRLNISFIFIGLALISCNSLQTGSDISLQAEANNSLPSTFSDVNILTTHIGMKSEDVLKRYGEPRNISQSICGGSTPGGSWTCTTWEYGKFPYAHAKFTFAEDKESLVINDFDIERSKESLPESFTTENIMKVKQGISHPEIFELFGAPRNVRQSTCGAGIGEPWICTTWEYGNPPYANARFTFSLGEDTMLLNDFKIERD